MNNIQIVEDIASDTFLKASEHWAINGIPTNPEAWLYTVAKNKAKDYLKHKAIFDLKVSDNIRNAVSEENIFTETDERTISDSQLAMLFAVCDPVIATEGQISLALQVLCGFSVNEVAQALLSNRETIKKRLFRAKDYLRKSNFEIKELSSLQITERLPTVLKSLYLLFNEGYYSKHQDQFVRKELCYEAIRLAVSLTENNLTNTAQVNALIALMCYQSSRLDARTGDTGEIILFDNQDRNLWNQDMIDKGNHYIILATDRRQTSKYHIEAAIAYWHTTSEQQSKWSPILQLYNQLILIEYSPITALNRAFAYAKVYGIKEGINETEKLKLEYNAHYFGLLGYLYTDLDPEQAKRNYQKAISLSPSAPERQLFKKRMREIQGTG
ncbi:RNA polymerase sigma factor [Sphingobacterium yanglingense]|uniref:RNA polymerase sigma-70 factor (ECF subfamily) n=1 Tax=Sphingobacterium yanglingense TaxID=1437280 RepID=A0A4R6WLY6_9SPHI|nr:DUF6596 domain-containing protein [Sphingobacterium yanglingense]TDQ79345.1 RNA polymerase sigma-70 factor (ECF subfamily) [Sphingobacterium yanglingense]